MFDITLLPLVINNASGMALSLGLCIYVCLQPFKLITYIFYSRICILNVSRIYKHCECYTTVVSMKCMSVLLQPNKYLDAISMQLNSNKSDHETVYSKSFASQLFCMQKAHLIFDASTVLTFVVCINNKHFWCAAELDFL